MSFHRASFVSIYICFHPVSTKIDPEIQHLVASSIIYLKVSFSKIILLPCLNRVIFSLRNYLFLYFHNLQICKFSVLHSKLNNLSYKRLSWNYNFVRWLKEVWTLSLPTWQMTAVLDIHFAKRNPHTAMDEQTKPTSLSRLQFVDSWFPTVWSAQRARTTEKFRSSDLKCI